jgi:septum formation protein
MAAKRLILASSSPRRASYLRDLGVPFRKIPADIDERRRRGERPHRYVRRLAVRKAEVVSARHEGSAVVGADTIVVVDGTILGKPRDAREAHRMLRKLSGRSHRVLSGMAIVDGRTSAVQRVRSGVSSTRVFFRKLNEDEIRWYVDTGEPLDKAGAYGIQGKGGLFVRRIEGSFSNVAGFPVELFYQLWGQSLTL